MPYYAYVYGQSLGYRHSYPTASTDLPPTISVLSQLLLPHIPNRPVNLILPLRSLGLSGFEDTFSVAVLEEGTSGAVEFGIVVE